jgi:GWxTD domain-containing protein
MFLAKEALVKIFSCFLLSALVGFCITARAQSPNSELPVGKRTVSNNMPSEYQHWLDQDVRWIITPEERTAFIRLSNREDRDQFVEKFWLRRDPTPGTAENEYKEEHYRRMAYANTHFAAAAPGWETDRGRTYIVYGPPDSIKVQGVRGVDGSEKTAQIWHYSSIPGYATGSRKDLDLEFVDTCSCGDYRLETPLP